MECSRIILMHTIYSNKIETASILVTRRCNFNCIHCSVDAGKELKNELKLEEIRKLLVELKQLKVKNIELSGGEPLLREDLFQIIRYAKKLGFYVKILSNGSLLSRGKIRKLKRIGLDEIAFSLDGYSYNSYHKIRKASKETFKRVIQNIKISGESGIFTKINFVVFKSNMADIGKLIKFCEKNNVGEFRICYLSRVGRARNLNEQIEPSKWLNITKKLGSSSVKVFFGYSYADFSSGCMLKEKILLTINSNGEVRICPMLVKVGDWRRNSLIEILNKASYRNCLNSKKYRGLSQVCPLKKFSLDDMNNKASGED
jgi:AdoMet-dependent heme synthase